MAKVLSFDFKHGEYFIGGEEVELADCLLEAGMEPVNIVFGTGWIAQKVVGFGGSNIEHQVVMTAAALAQIAPYLPDGSLTVRMVFSISESSVSDMGGWVQFGFINGTNTAGRYLVAVHMDPEGGYPPVFPAPTSQYGNSSGHSGALTGDYPTSAEAADFALAAGRHGLAISFGPDEIALSLDGGDETVSGETPEDFTFEEAWINIGIGNNDAGDVGGQTAILELFEVYADTGGGGGGGGAPVPDLPELSDPNPDGSGDGLVDDSVRMRCWTFSLDGHDYAVFRLGAASSLVYDLTTNTWSEWASPALDYWRAHIGQNWLGAGADTLANGSDIVAGDDSSGVLWILDPEYGRDDRSTTGSDYFERVVTGGLSVSGRDVVPCGAVTVDCSVGAPTQTDAAITLEISDDFGHNFTDCGSVTTVTGERDTVVEWRGLGFISAPGRVFRFTDNGATVRFAAANLR